VPRQTSASTPAFAKCGTLERAEEITRGTGFTADGRFIEADVLHDPCKNSGGSSVVAYPAGAIASAAPPASMAPRSTITA